MDELISNLEHCLSIFEAPTVASTEHNLYFIKSSIGQFVIPYLNRKGIPNGMDILSLDNKYLVTNQADMKKIIEWDWTDNRKYVAEKYDCDNFAFSFKAMVDRKFGVNNVGLVIDYSSGHAYNIIVFNDGAVRLFEPQTDKWPRIGTSMYKFEEGKILI